MEKKLQDVDDKRRSHSRKEKPIELRCLVLPRIKFDQECLTTRLQFIDIDQEVTHPHWSNFREEGTKFDKPNVVTFLMIS
jgi:pyruvate-formate lyase-activating enzyme